jgi:methyltransferase (TIGR00027 family)
MAETDTAGPESTAARVALWRALHREVDGEPSVIDDRVGLELLAPGDDWRARPDMDPAGTRGFRAWIVARAAYLDELVAAQHASGVEQYVILGAGLDSFAQRHAELARQLQVFEIDMPGPQSWKKRRLIETGYGHPDWLHFVPVDFEAGESWRVRLYDSGFSAERPTLVSSTGVTMYLSRAATSALLAEVASLGTSLTLAMTFQIPTPLLDEADRPGRAMVERAAAASGTPFLSYFDPEEMCDLARDAGFATAEHLSGRVLADRYFAGRADGLWPSTGEDFLIATR